MSLLAIKAFIECDGCGAHFSVGMDAAYVPPDDWTLFEVAEDSVRGSLDYEQIAPKNAKPTMSSVQREKMLCGVCTTKADNETPDEGTAKPEGKQT